MTRRCQASQALDLRPSLPLPALRSPGPSGQNHAIQGCERGRSCPLFDGKTPEIPNELVDNFYVRHRHLIIEKIRVIKLVDQPPSESIFQRLHTMFNMTHFRGLNQKASPKSRFRMAAYDATHLTSIGGRCQGESCFSSFPSA